MHSYLLIVVDSLSRLSFLMLLILTLIDPCLYLSFVQYLDITSVF